MQQRDGVADALLGVDRDQRRHAPALGALAQDVTDRALAVALLHEYRVSQLPVVSEHDASEIVGSVAERGLLAHAVSDPSLLDARMVDVMEPPLPVVTSEDPVSVAIEVLVGERQALIVLDGGHPAGIVSRADLLEALTR